MCMSIYIYKYLSICIYLYGERDREILRSINLPRRVSNVSKLSWYLSVLHPFLLPEHPWASIILDFVSFLLYPILSCQWWLPRCHIISLTALLSFKLWHQPVYHWDTQSPRAAKQLLTHSQNILFTGSKLSSLLPYRLLLRCHRCPWGGQYLGEL